MTQEHEDFFYEPPSSNPPLYRFCELLGVVGEALKGMIKDGDSSEFLRAVDLHLNIEKVTGETDDYFAINLHGKFYPESESMIPTRKVETSS